MSHMPPVFLPVSLAKNIVFRAFLLAQGNAAIQARLFEYVALMQPRWRMADEALSDLISQVTVAFHRFFAQGWHQQTSATAPHLLEQEVGEAVLALQYALAHSLVERELLLSELWVDIVRRDHFFLVTKEGRLRSKSPHVTVSPAAPYFSHLCQYGFGQIPVGLAEFDQLFREITLALQEHTAIFRRRMAQPDVPEQLTQVIAVHNRHYPDALVVLP
ncbi:MAG TPA: hypothetical protein VFV38_31630 [Ktedonobacteraceae bacterium]|nr:hypothetical protein [Ktedonobacteraceae bacterium]